MSFFKRLFGKSVATTPESVAPTLEPRSLTSMLDEAQAFVVDLWRKNGSLVRQAVFWTSQDKAIMVGFTDAVSRDETIRQVLNAAVGKSAVRLWFFGESSARSPDGTKIDVIVLEVADQGSATYGQRILSTDEEPAVLDESTSSLSKSPFPQVFE